MEIELNPRQQMFAAIGFGAVLIIIALLLILLGGSSTLQCTRGVNNEGICVYKVSSIFNNNEKSFKVADLKGSKVDCNTSRSHSSGGGNTTSCNIRLNTTSKAGSIKMEYGNSKYEGKILTQNDQINKFSTDMSIPELKVTQSNCLLIGIVSGILAFFGLLLTLIPLMIMKKL